MDESVGIAYCHGGSVHEPFMRSMLSSWIWDSERAKIYRGYFSCGGLYIAINRNKAVTEFLAKDAQWLWFLDTDIIFREDTCYRLLQQADPVQHPIVSALYFGRMAGGNSTQPVWLRENSPGEYTTLSQFSSDLYELDAVGMGCCLIHRSVLEKMRDVYTQDEWQWFGHDVVLKKDGKRTHIGEDLTFCRRARALGYTIWGDGSTIVGHMKSRMEDLETFKKDTAVDFKVLDKPLSNSAA